MITNKYKCVKQTLSLVLCLAMLLTGLPNTVFAQETEGQTEQTEAGVSEEDGVVKLPMIEISAPVTDLPDNNELFAGYAEQYIFGMGGTAMVFAALSVDHLKEVDQEVYYALKEKISEVAEKGGSTEFVLDVKDKGVTYTVNQITGNSISGDFNINVEKIIKALLEDCPYELYWYDKTLSTSYGTNDKFDASLTNGTVVNLETLTFKFPAASAYQEDSAYKVSSTKVTTAQTAKTNADKVIKEAVEKSSDYEKLLYCLDYIKDNVDYGAPNSTDKNTWQMIWVFDGDSNTNVVCEGYAKAFKYLCDGIGVECYTVSGDMNGSDGQGGAHMWNIVVLDEKSYLVDPTNCDGVEGGDTNPVGYPYKLFLQAPSSGSGTAEAPYVFSNASGVTYSYDEGTVSLLGDTEILTLEDESYEAPVSYTVTINSSEHGTVTVASKSVAEGTTVILDVKPDDGYELDTLSVTCGESQTVEVKDNQFTMPGENVTVTATFKLSQIVTTLTDDMVTLSMNKTVYNGSEQNPTVTVKNGDTTLTEGKDYEVAFLEDMTNAGDKNITITGKGNYTGKITKVMNIEAKQLTVTGATATSRDYDGSNEVKITGVTLDGIVTDDKVNVDLAEVQGTLSSANAGTYTSVTLPKLTLTGDDAGNYTLVQPTGAVTTNVTINKLKPTITVANRNYSKTYGDAAFSLDVSANNPETDVKYEVTAGKDVVSVSNGTVTVLKAGEATITVTLPESTNYDAAENVTITIHVEKAEYPQNKPASTINASNACTKVSDVTTLPAGWVWADNDKDTALKVDEAVTATAQYTGTDKENYKNLTVTVSITRSECDHTEGEVVWDSTVETDKAPTCTETGIGHTSCTKSGCGDVIKTGITVPALDHDYESKVTTEATYTTEGVRTYTCKRSECGRSYTESIPKLTKPSGSGSSSSTTNPPSTEAPSTEEPSTEEPSTQNPSTEEPSTEEPSTEAPSTEIPSTSEDSTIEWKTDENGTFYEKEDGTRATGWMELEDGDWYYFDENGYRETGWQKVGKDWYYLNETGKMQTGWQKDGKDWYYLSESGSMKTGWQKDGKDWYYLSENGAMKTGWQKDGKDWYYLSESGAMKTGWQKDGKDWYYLSESGSMKTGWQKDGKDWYYLSENGAMKTGWQKDGETWYYLNASGAMQTGWIQLGMDWFYLNANGSMAADTYIGTWYVDKNGYYIPSRTK